MSKSTGNDGVVFLLGAGRSGTTLLYKLLGLHPAIAYISNYENRVGWLPIGWLLRNLGAHPEVKLGAWFNRGNAYFMHRPVAKRIVPTPVEGEDVYASCGIPWQLPGDFVPSQAAAARLRSRFSKIRADFGADILLSKRTANNRRLRLLDRIFPSARYIHLIRDGRDVARSLSRVEWWSDHVLFWDGRRAAELERAGESRIALCARNWVHEMAELETGLAGIDRNRVHELRYEALLQNPVEQLSAILTFLGVPSTGAYVDAVRSLQLSYHPFDWQAESAQTELARIMQEQQVTLRRLGYAG